MCVILILLLFYVFICLNNNCNVTVMFIWVSYIICMHILYWYHNSYAYLCLVITTTERSTEMMLVITVLMK